ncbi:MAG: HDOD domain-containing protein [Sandaracinaceae bacterium]
MRSKARAPGYGQGVVALDTRGWLDPDSVPSMVTQIFEAAAYRPPPLPAVALEVDRLSRRSDIGIDDVTRVLARDPMLAADTLRVASSAAYSRGQAPRTLEEACVRLGVKGLRNIVWQVGLRGVFRVRGYSAVMERLQSHSVSVARLTREVAMHTSVAADNAFLFALLHDVGLVAALHAIRDAHTGDLPPYAELHGGLSALHASLGGTVSRLWNLPGEMVWLIENHSWPRVDGFIHPLLACLSVAHHYSALQGESIRLSNQVSEHEQESLAISVEALGLSRSDLLDIESRCAPLNG